MQGTSYVVSRPEEETDQTMVMTKIETRDDWEAEKILKEVSQGRNQVIN